MKIYREKELFNNSFSLLSIAEDLRKNEGILIKKIIYQIY